MKYTIYIKGGQRLMSAAFAFSIERDGEIIEQESGKFDGEIPTKHGSISIDAHKGQYQMELYAFAYALTRINDQEADITLFSNNNAVVSWIRNMVAPEQYANLFSVCQQFAKDKKIKSRWVAKKDLGESNQWVNDEVEQLLPNDFDY